MSKIEQVEKLSQLSVHAILGHNHTARATHFLAGRNIFVREMPPKWFGAKYHQIVDGLDEDFYPTAEEMYCLFSLGELTEEVRGIITEEPTGYYALYDKLAKVYLKEDLGVSYAKYWTHDVNQAKLYTNLNDLVNIIAEVGTENTIIISPKGV